MSRCASSDLFSLDNDPDVIAARKRHRDALKAVQTASYGWKRKREFQLQAALHNLLRVERQAQRKLEEAGYVRPKSQKQETPRAPRQDDFTPRECGDDTNYRPYQRKEQGS